VETARLAPFPPKRSTIFYKKYRFVFYFYWRMAEEDWLSIDGRVAMGDAMSLGICTMEMGCFGYCC